MLDKWLKAPVHDILHYLGTIILIIGIPMNKVLMSTGTIWVASNLLLKADFKKYYHNIKNSKIAVLVLLIFLIHLIGLLYTTEFDYALHDLNSKLPFFVLPMVLIAFPLNPIFYKDIIYGFLAVVLLTSCTNIFLFFTETRQGTEDIRLMSLFGSHIRYGVIVLFAAIICFYLIIKEAQKWKKIIFLVLFTWFTFYTIYAQVITAYFNLIIITISFIVYMLFRVKNIFLRLSLITVFFVFIGFSVLNVYSFLKPKITEVKLTDLDTHTKQGNEYIHFPTHKVTENGTPIMIYICDEELEPLWNNSSTISYYDEDKKGHLIRGTLFRYMSSLGLRKDAEGFSQLTDNDIKNIENGIPSYKIASSALLNRLEGLRLQIQNYYLGQDPSGHSLLQRFEHWRASFHIIAKNPILGVGTGDVPDAFKTAYLEIESNLHPDYQNRSHNQFLAFWVAFGIVGFILLTLLNFVIIQKGLKQKQSLLTLFGVLFLLSFLPEDTLETQQGATFIGFFLGFLHLKVKGV